jgi:hypothetical protein
MQTENAMPTAILEIVGPIIALFLIGTFILLYPISRRLGQVMGEWIKLRSEASPDRDRVARLEYETREIRYLVESIDSRLELIGERQDFIESLVETSRARELPTSPAEPSGSE